MKYSRNSLDQLKEIDPTTVPNPVSGEVVRGVYQGLHWTRNSAGVIVYGITSDTLTTTVSITNATLTDGVYTQSGKVVLIANGVNTINYTINAGITASFVKGGTGAITFVQGAGRTLTGVNGTLVFNGAVNSTASIVSFGTTDYLYINNL